MYSQKPTNKTETSSNSGSCGFNMTVTNQWQNFSTPNYPLFYPEQSKCNWFINLDKTSKLEYQIYGNTEEYYDYLFVSNSKNKNIINLLFFYLILNTAFDFYQLSNI